MSTVRPSRAHAKRVQVQNGRRRTISRSLGLGVAVISLMLLIVIVTSGLSLLPKLLLSVALLVVSGEILSMLVASQRLFYGIYMFRTKLGLNAMERLAKRAPWFWNGLADWGLVMGFGLLSLVLFRKSVSKRMVAFGTASIVVLLLFVLPNLGLGLNFVDIPQITSHIQSTTAQAPAGLDYLAYAMYALSVLGGFTAYIIFSLLYNAASIIYALLIALVTSFTPHPNYSGLGQSIPGVAPIIPGITIPLFAGILSLALLLVVHEFSHGILARISKVRITSSGGLLFGVIPIGAFVEPDEKRIEKLKVQAQNRISAAGVASNMLLSVIFFLFMLLFIYFVMPYVQKPYVYIVATVPNSPANSIISPGSVVLKWNGYNISTLSDFKVAAANDISGAHVSIVTNNGSYTLTANSTGKVGVFVNQGAETTGGILGHILTFIYSFFALSFLLNFLVAVVNYLPIPSFDGWRVFNSSIKNKKIVLAISVIVVVSLLVNILPWIWLG